MRKTEKPENFESDICKAAKDGKLSSVIYLIEQMGVKVETKDSVIGNTPLCCASFSGKLDIVKYLIEICHANTEAKNNNSFTPLILAVTYNHFNIIKYLVDACHVKVTRDAITFCSDEEIEKYLHTKI